MMLNIKSYRLSVTIILLLFFLSPQSLLPQQDIELNCLTVIVGKNVSKTGSVIVAHNEDDFGKQLVNLYSVDAKKQNSKNEIILKNGGKVQQVKQTNGFFWIQLPGMDVADTYVNDKGVLITSNGCPSIEDKPDSTDGGILYWLRRIVSQRAYSAKHGVKLAGKLIEKYGYVSAGRSYTIADKDEAWVLAAVYGKHWVAQRVPDDQVAVIPNYYTIRKIDLSDTNNFLGSIDIIDYATDRGWYNPENEFDFAKIYTADFSLEHPGNINRIWRGINLLSNEAISMENNFPFSFEPYKKNSAKDIITILQDHYEYSELDKSELYKKGNPHFENYATICSESTQYSFVALLRDEKFSGLNNMMWISIYRPCANIYSPIYLTKDFIPESFAFTNSDIAIEQQFYPDSLIFEKNDSHAYWDSFKLVEKIDSQFANSYPYVKVTNDILQNKLFLEVDRFEKSLFSLENNSERIKKYIDEFSNKNLKLLRETALQNLE